MAQKLSPQELRAQLAAVVKDQQPEIVALSTPAEFDGESLEYKGRNFLVRKARSVLEFHDLIDQAQGSPLLCLTQLSDQEIGLDLRCRLHKRRVQRVDTWTAVRHLFDCQGVESNLVAQPHLAAYLLESQPVHGYAKVKGEILTAEHAWSCLFTYRLGMPGEFLDSLSLLGWANGDRSGFLGAPSDLKDSARQRIAQTCGELGSVILACVEDQRLNATAMGLALGCLAMKKPDLVQSTALTRVEQYVGSRPMTTKIARDWADAAEHLVGAERESSAPYTGRAEEILGILLAPGKAHLSDFLPLGMSQRLDQLGTSLRAAIESEAKIAELEIQCRKCRSHHALDTEQGETVRMLPRLVRWLHSPNDNHSKKSFAELVSHFAHDTAYAEWARVRCEGGLGPEVKPAVNQLLERVATKMESVAQTFSKGLSAWNSAGEPDDQLWKVEQLLEKLLVPIVSHKGGRFLLVVLDGCGWPTMHELMESFPNENWLRLSPLGSDTPPALLATYPSVTEFSRTSLLCGTLMQGNSSVEKTRFRDHPTLRAACGQGYPPILFHKAELDDGHGGLSNEVESKILNAKHKAVGVVLNAVDDHLDKDDQVCHAWGLANIRYLSDLVTRAYQSDRTLVFVSDHGHVLQRRAELSKVAESGGARWRPGDKAKKGEIVLAGPRVLSGGKTVVLPWSDEIRYTKKKNGYHGGCHPAELICSLLVLCKGNSQGLKGWNESFQPKPSWWLNDSPDQSLAILSPATVKPKKEKLATGQMLLISETPPPPPSFADTVLSFPLVEDSWKQAKTAPDKERARELLSYLESHGDQAEVTELASHFGLPEARFRQLLQSVSALLQVDGQYIVSITPDTRSVLLNRGSLATTGASKSAMGSHIEVERANGDWLSFWVPLKKLDRNERLVLENLAKFGQLTETELKQAVGTKRIGGTVEKLMERLNKEGFHNLSQVGEGSAGRIYRLEAGGLS